MGQDSARTTRSLWWTLAPSVLCALLAIWACVWLWLWGRDPHNMPIRHVRISNSYQHVTRTSLQEVIQPYLKEGFLTLPLADLRSALIQLTWVEQVRVARLWPDSLLITVQEQQAAARWGYGGVLNGNGVLFHPDERDIPSGLPMIMGPSELSQSIFQHYQMLQTLLAPSELAITSVQVSPRRSWQIQLDNHMVIILGSQEHRARLSRFIRALPKLKQKMGKHIHQVDLRYPNGFAVS